VTLGHSFKRDLWVRAQLELKPPSVKEAPGDTLNPIAAKDSLTVVVPQGDLLPTDQLSVTWTGAAGTPAGGSHTTTPAPISNIGREIPIPTSVVAFNLGKAVTVTYTIVRSGATSTPSQPLNLNVQAIPNEDGALPMPAIEGAVGNELNIGTLIGTENLRIAAWPLQLSGQRVWLRYDGTDTAGDATDEIVWTGQPHNYTGDLATRAPHAWLKTLKDGTDLKVTFRVNFDKVSNAATAVTFPIRTYTVRELALIKPTLDSVKGSPSGEEIPDNGYTVETAVTLSGTATQGLEVEVFDGATSRGKATANATTGIWTLSVSGLSQAAHSFKAKALYGSGVESAVRTFTVEADADAPVFTNGPYLIQPGETFKDIILSLQTGSGTPVPNADITLVLPAGFTYADGGSGSRVFRTGTDGMATISGVKGPSAPGGHDMTATYRSKTATARLAIVGVVGTISGFSSPRHLAVSPDGAYIFVVNENANTISVINAASQALIKTIPVGALPRWIACTPDGSQAFVCNYADKTISVIDIANLRLIKTTAIGSYPTGIVSSLDGTRLCLSNYDSASVSIINTADMVRVKTIGVGSNPNAPIISPDGTLLFVSTYGSNTVTVIDALNLTWIKRIDVQTNPQDIACSPDGSRVFVGYRSDSRLSVIDIATEVIQHLDLAAPSFAVTINPDGSTIYTSGRGQILLVDSVSLTVRMTVTVGQFPTAIASSPDGTRIYVANYDSHTVSVISVG
jgi:YVTN family beta-propeller protein